MLDKYEKYGLEYIQEKLNQLDPTHYQSVDIKNPQRIIRAIEVCLTTNKPYSSFLNLAEQHEPLPQELHSYNPFDLHA